jgi:hypothetical protein
MNSFRRSARTLTGRPPGPGQDGLDRPARAGYRQRIRRNKDKNSSAVMDSEVELHRRVVAGLVAIAMVAGACTSTRVHRGEPRRLGIAGALAADWEVGDGGGVLSTPDGSITVNLPKGAAQPGTKVHLQRDQAPGSARLPGFLPMASFDISANTGRLRAGEVTVRYDGQLLQRLHSDPDLLVMLISDDRHGWLVLPTAIDRAAGRRGRGRPRRAAGRQCRWRPCPSHRTTRLPADPGRRTGQCWAA